MGLKEKLPADRRRFLLTAIQCCGSQEKLAARTGLKVSRINFLLNRAKSMRYEEAVLIARVTEGAVHPLQLADHVDHLSPGLKGQLAADSRSFQALKLSERIRVAQDHEVKLKQQPQGTVKGRVETPAAKIADLGNYKTYHQAKQVLQWGIPELVTAMDDKRLKIFTLSKMVRYTPEQQRDLLALPHRKINAWMRQHLAPTPAPVFGPVNSVAGKSAVSFPAPLWLPPALAMRQTTGAAAVTDTLFRLLTDRRLYQAERRTGWPLRLLCVCLGCFADPSGQVEKEWETLRQRLLDEGWEVAVALQALMDLGWLRESPFEEESSS